MHGLHCVPSGASCDGFGFVSLMSCSCVCLAAAAGAAGQKRVAAGARHNWHQRTQYTTRSFLGFECQCFLVSGSKASSAVRLLWVECTEPVILGQQKPRPLNLQPLQCLTAETSKELDNQAWGLIMRSVRNVRTLNPKP